MLAEHVVFCYFVCMIGLGQKYQILLIWLQTSLTATERTGIYPCACLDIYGSGYQMHLVQLKSQLHRSSARVAFLFVFTYNQGFPLQKVNRVFSTTAQIDQMELDQYIVALSPVRIGHAYQTSCCNQRYFHGLLKPNDWRQRIEMSRTLANSAQDKSRLGKSWGFGVWKRPICCFNPEKLMLE